MNAKIWSLLFCVILISIGCKNEVNTGDDNVMQDGVITVDMNHQAGNSWSSNGSGYLPSPFNVGKHKDLDVLVLSNALNKRGETMVKVLGTVKLEEDQKVNHYIVAVPARASQQSMDLISFEDLITSQSSAKWIVEQYLLNRNGMGSARLIAWEDGNYVMNKLLNNNL